MVHLVKEEGCIDNSKFKSIISEGAYMHLNDYDSVPHSIGEEHVTLGGWKFKTTSTTFYNAKALDIIKGWNLLVNNNIPIDILFLSCFSKAISESKIPGIDALEPDLLGLVRMCYWYHNCSKLPDECNFAYKKQEIKEKLARDLPDTIEKLGIHINYNDISDLKNKLKKALEELQKKDPGQLYSRTQEISNTIFDYTAELMYSFLSSQSKNLSFQRNLPLEKNADLFIEGIDAEVKNINDTLDEKLEYKKEKMQDIIDLRDVFNRFLKRTKVIKRINDALEQKARIVLLNATQTYPGFVLNKYASGKEIDIPLSAALNDSFEILNNNQSQIAVIFGASAIDNNWKFRFSSFVIPIPVRRDNSGRLVIDESQL